MNNLIWFRNDLRVKDNTSLFKASKNAKRIAAVYCFDPRQFQEDQFGFKKTERFRAQFLIETVTELREHLAELNIPLFVYNEQPEDILPPVIERLQIDQLFFQEEWTSEEQESLERLKNRVQHRFHALKVMINFSFILKIFHINPLKQFLMYLRNGAKNARNP